MKLAFFNDYQLGVLEGDQVIDITSLIDQVPTSTWLTWYVRPTPQQIMNKLISQFSTLKPEIERIIKESQGIPISEVRIRPPLPRPGKIICAAVNYLEFGTRPPSPLEAFIKSSNSVIGDGDTVELPNIPATIFHHEAELAVVIGKLAKNVTAAQSMDYVFGYTNFMDVSARGFAPLGPGRMSFFMIKSSDTFGPMGPCIVTKDEINDPHDLDVKLWNKGEIRHDFNTSDMSNKIPELIEYCSSITSLEPGDIISTGTNHQGIGAIQDGDQLLMEIKGLGQLNVNVTDAQKRSWPRGIDQDMANAMLGDIKP